uniref:DUF4283 domain-containing protein n=1 Tax=Cannabis sativa TaxID=3483 RepID=A0A803QBJ2_CANSA
MMASLFQPVKGMYVKELEHNHYIFQFYHELDLKCVINGSLWTFNKTQFVFVKLKPGVDPRTMVINHLDIARWLRTGSNDEAFDGDGTTGGNQQACVIGSIPTLTNLVGLTLILKETIDMDNVHIHGQLILWDGKRRRTSGRDVIGPYINRPPNVFGGCEAHYDGVGNGYPYTWERGKGGANWTEVQLDRALYVEAKKNLAKIYIQKKYSGASDQRNYGFMKAINIHNVELLAPVLDDEVKKALYQMHPDKFPGPDGMTLDFYQ